MPEFNDIYSATDKISVIIPTYNRAHLICESIQSALLQTHNNIEVIVIDDASTDNTRQVIKKINDNRICYFRHDRNKGASCARNTGLKKVNGQYVAFLDDDDKWLPSKLEKQLDIFNNGSKSIGLVTCGFRYCYKDQFVEKVLTNEVREYDKLLVQNVIGSNSLPLVKKECFENAGFFDETLQSCQDWDLWIRIAKNYSIDYIPDVLVERLVHGNQITGDINKKIQGREIILKKYFDLLKNNSRLLAEHYYKIGRLYALKKNKKKVIEYFVMAIKNHPTKVNSYIHLILGITCPFFHEILIKKLIIISFGNVKLYH